MAASLQVFSHYQTIERKGIASIHDSGGERELIVDIADDLSVPFAHLSKETREKLTNVLEPTMDTNNPLDAWGSGHDADKLFKNAFLHLLSDKNVSLGLYVQDWRQDYYLHLMHEKILLEVKKETKKPIIAVSNYSMTIDQEMAKRFLDNGIPLVKGTKEALIAIKNLLNNKKIKFSLNPRPKNKKFVKWRIKLNESKHLDPVEGFALLNDLSLIHI